MGQSLICIFEKIAQKEIFFSISAILFSTSSYQHNGMQHSCFKCERNYTYIFCFFSVVRFFFNSSNKMLITKFCFQF